jgi:DNA-binding MarR family transcriptional regulator
MTTTTTSTAAPTLSPQIVGQAERAHKPILDRILARAGTTMTQWVALKLTAASGGAADRDQLINSITGALRIDDAAAVAAIAELTTAGLLTDPPGKRSRLGFTGAGQALYQQINNAVGEVVARAYADIPAGDLVTAARVLTLITTRLNAEHA